MKNIPILYGTAMVIAQLAGLKTQTRRVFKDQEILFQMTSSYERTIDEDQDEVSFMFDKHRDDDGTIHPAEWLCYSTEYPEEGVIPIGQCPYGRPGDLHWVRETFNRTNPGGEHGIYYYKADGKFPDCIGGGDFVGDEVWKPSIFMPRDAARLFNRVTTVHIERVQAISREDAIAEGFKAITKDNGKTIKYGIPDLDGLPGNDNHGWPWVEWCVDPVQAYRKLWNSINLVPKPIMEKGAITGYVAYPWSEADFDYEYPDIRASRMYKGRPITIYANPFVWVTRFKRDEQGGAA